jgi:hypothetical protein
MFGTIGLSVAKLFGGAVLSYILLDRSSESCDSHHERCLMPRAYHDHTQVEMPLRLPPLAL